VRVMTRTVSFSLLLFTMLMGLSEPQRALAVSGMSSGRGRGCRGTEWRC
jgi:hypothetical protein